MSPIAVFPTVAETRNTSALRNVRDLRLRLRAAFMKEIPCCVRVPMLIF